MRNFAIITDSCGDLNAENRKKYDVDYVPMRLLYEESKGKTVDIPASLDWEYLSAKDFYDLMRKGTRVRTAQVPSSDYRAKFTECLEKGMDVLSISCSSALSASFEGSKVVAEELGAKYPDAKIICVDSLNSCLGLAILCMTASALRGEGKSIEEIAAYIEANKLKMNQFATVEDLTYLKRAGRVSAASAVFGGLLQVKPIIISDAIGQNVAIEKVKGRKNSIARILELTEKAFDPACPYKKIGVGHADAPEDAATLVKALSEKYPDVEIVLDYIGPIVGASTGPGTLGVYCFGDEVTFADVPKK